MLPCSHCDVVCACKGIMLLPQGPIIKIIYIEGVHVSIVQLEISNPYYEKRISQFLLSYFPNAKSQVLKLFWFYKLSNRMVLIKRSDLNGNLIIFIWLYVAQSILCTAMLSVLSPKGMCKSCCMWCVQYTVMMTHLCGSADYWQ